jgi:hypothetical protein
VQGGPNSDDGTDILVLEVYYNPSTEKSKWLQVIYNVLCLIVCSTDLHRTNEDENQSILSNLRFRSLHFDRRVASACFVCRLERVPY